MIEMKRYLAILIFLLVANMFAAELFDLPKGTRIFSRDNSGKTWQVNAVVDMPWDKAKKLLHEAILKKNYKLKHEIPMGEKGEKHIIISYLKEKENLILMIWSPDGKKTFFAYGVTRQ